SSSESSEHGTTDSAGDLQSHLKSQKNPFEEDLTELSKAESLENQPFDENAKADPGQNLNSDNASESVKIKDQKWWKF
ncbi:hypothetical protein D0809_24640, partial [Flavobacterium circumlabens]